MSRSKDSPATSGEPSISVPSNAPQEASRVIAAGLKGSSSEYNPLASQWESTRPRPMPTNRTAMEPPHGLKKPKTIFTTKRPPTRAPSSRTRKQKHGPHSRDPTELHGKRTKMPLECESGPLRCNTRILCVRPRCGRAVTMSKSRQHTKVPEANLESVKCRGQDGVHATTHADLHAISPVNHHHKTIQSRRDTRGISCATTENTDVMSPCHPRK